MQRSKTQPTKATINLGCKKRTAQKVGGRCSHHQQRKQQANHKTAKAVDCNLWQPTCKMRTCEHRSAEASKMGMDKRNAAIKAQQKYSKRNLTTVNQHEQIANNKDEPERANRKLRHSEAENREHQERKEPRKKKENKPQPTNASQTQRTTKTEHPFKEPDRNITHTNNTDKSNWETNYGSNMDRREWHRTKAQTSNFQYRDTQAITKLGK